MKNLAHKLGVSAKDVTRWRDGRGSLTTASLTIRGTFEGVLIVNGEPYPRTVVAVLRSNPPEADDIWAAWAADDFEEFVSELRPENPKEK